MAVEDALGQQINIDDVVVFASHYDNKVVLSIGIVKGTDNTSKSVHIKEIFSTYSDRLHSWSVQKDFVFVINDNFENIVMAKKLIAD